MFSFLRRSATSIFAWLILGALALVFGLQFGLPSDSLSFGTSTYGNVHGESIRDTDVRAEGTLLRLHLRVPEDAQSQASMGVIPETVDAIIERDLLAATAEQLGLGATRKDAEDLLLSGQTLVMGYAREWLGNSPPSFKAFDYKTFTTGLLPFLGLSEPQYLDAQEREILARDVRDVVSGSTVVGESEVRRAYEAQANRLSLRYARYSALVFGDLVDPSDEDIQAWAAEHRDELAQQYKAQGSRFAKLAKQARLWIIEVPNLTPSPTAAGSDGAVAPRPSPLLRDAQARLAAGEDFRAVARSLSSHETAQRGGDFGWVSEASGTGIDPALDAQLPTLAVGQISGPIAGDKVSYIIKISGRREGDVPEQDAVLELAEEAYRRARGQILAKQAAAEDLASVSAGTALTSVFKGGSALGSEGGIETEAPSPGARPKVELRETGSFAKGDAIPGLGAAPDLVNAAWEAPLDASLMPQTFTVGDDVVLVGVVHRETASDEGYAKAREELYRTLRAEKADLVTSSWARQRCLRDLESGHITVATTKINKDLIKAGADLPQQATYTACERVGSRGKMMFSGLREGL